MASENGSHHDSSDEESLASLPPEMRVYRPSDDVPVRPSEPEPEPEPAYEQVPLSSLSGTPAPQRSEEVPRRTGSRGLPSKSSLLVMAIAAVVLVSVPFALSMLLVDDEAEGHRAVQPLDQPGPSGELRPSAPPTGAPPQATATTPSTPDRTGTPTTPVAAPPPAPPRTTTPPAPAPFYAGPGCPSTARLNYQPVGYYQNGSEGWTSGSSGSREGGCSGRFDAMPMSGKADSPNPDLYAKWTFDVSDRITTGRCTIAAYIPNSDDPRAVGARRAHYSIFGSFDSSAANVIDTADVDQVAHRGSWVDLGEVPVGQGKLAVKLQNRGEDWAGGTDGEGAHIAAAQLRVTCTPT